VLILQLRICTVRSQSMCETGLGVGADVHLMKISEHRVVVDMIPGILLHKVRRPRVNLKSKKHHFGPFVSSLYQGLFVIFQGTERCYLASNAA
jgi:hypothetical protein